jgi:hypothetical protein
MASHESGPGIHPHVAFELSKSGETVQFGGVTIAVEDLKDARNTYGVRLRPGRDYSPVTDAELVLAGLDLLRGRSIGTTRAVSPAPAPPAPAGETK